MIAQRAVLVTGVSSGIGHAIAERLAQREFAVFGTSRNPASPPPAGGVEVLPLDVRLDESVEACVDAVLERAGRLDVLVNNAGYVLRGAAEEVTLEEARAQLETNFFGAVRMIKAVLPTMRGQRSGHIVNMSSVVGLVAMPFGGWYAASKFALEGYTEALRHEVKPFGVQVSLVEPGIVRSRLTENTQDPTEPIRDYDPWRRRVLEARRRYGEKAAEPALVAECVRRIVESKHPGLRHAVGADATRLVWLRRLVPATVLERGVRRVFDLDANR